MTKKTINGIVYIIPENLSTFDIKIRESSNVAFFGFNEAKQLFVQFKSKASYIYEDLTDDHIAMVNDENESIGKFVANILTKNYHGRRVLDFITMGNPTVLVKDDFYGPKKNLLAKKHQELEVVGRSGENLIVVDKSGNTFGIAENQTMKRK